MIGNRDETDFAPYGPLVLPMAARLAAGYNGEAIGLNYLDDFPEGAFQAGHGTGNP